MGIKIDLDAKNIKAVSDTISVTRVMFEGLEKVGISPDPNSDGILIDSASSTVSALIKIECKSDIEHHFTVSGKDLMRGIQTMSGKCDIEFVDDTMIIRGDNGSIRSPIVSSDMSGVGVYHDYDDYDKIEIDPVIFCDVANTGAVDQPRPISDFLCINEGAIYSIFEGGFGFSEIEDVVPDDICDTIPRKILGKNFFPPDSDVYFLYSRPDKKMAFLYENELLKSYISFSGGGIPESTIKGTHEGVRSLKQMNKVLSVPYDGRLVSGLSYLRGVNKSKPIVVFDNTGSMPVNVLSFSESDSAPHYYSVNIENIIGQEGQWALDGRFFMDMYSNGPSFFVLDDGKKSMVTSEQEVTYINSKRKYIKARMGLAGGASWSASLEAYRQSLEK